MKAEVAVLGVPSLIVFMLSGRKAASEEDVPCVCVQCTVCPVSECSVQSVLCLSAVYSLPCV